MKTGVPILAAVILMSGLAVAEPMPAYGPQTFAGQTGSGDTYTESFDLPAGGGFVLLVQNGDDESTRVTSATISLNGDVVVGPEQVNAQTAGLRRLVALPAGSNEVTVDIEGAPGSFLTLAVAEPGHSPVFVVGRLVLPRARHDGSRSLTLDVKNGSPANPRGFRVAFFESDGSLVMLSDPIHLPPRGSVSLSAADLLQGVSFDGGSVELIFAGPGIARLFASAEEFDNLDGSRTVQTLERAGLHISRGRPDPTHSGRPPRR